MEGRQRSFKFFNPGSSWSQKFILIHEGVLGTKNVCHFPPARRCSSEQSIFFLQPVLGCGMLFHLQGRWMYHTGWYRRVHADRYHACFWGLPEWRVRRKKGDGLLPFGIKVKTQLGHPVPSHPWWDEWESICKPSYGPNGGTFRTPAKGNWNEILVIALGVPEQLRAHTRRLSLVQLLSLPSFLHILWLGIRNGKMLGEELKCS